MRDNNRERFRAWRARMLAGKRCHHTQTPTLVALPVRFCKRADRLAVVGEDNSQRMRIQVSAHPPPQAGAHRPHPSAAHLRPASQAAKCRYCRQREVLVCVCIRYVGVRGRMCELRLWPDNFRFAGAHAHVRGLMVRPRASGATAATRRECKRKL